jgi:hypothetical protein
MSQQITNISTLESAASLSESETAQIRLSLEGDLQAFSDLVRPYRPMFYKKALSISPQRGGCGGRDPDCPAQGLYETLAVSTRFPVPNLGDKHCD